MNHRFINILMSLLIIFLVLGVGIGYYILKYKPSKELKKQNEIEEIKEKVEEKKNIILEKIEPENIINEDEEVDNISDNHYYEKFYLENLGEFYFKQENNKLNLYFLDEKILNFEFEKKENILVKEVIGNNNNIFIKIGGEKYLYNIITKKLKNIDIKLDIEYIKSGKNNFEFLFKTKVGIFIYSSQDNKINYFTFFKDFIYFKSGYLGIINLEEKEKLKNLGFEKENQNLIIFYDSKTKEKNIIYKTKLNLNKIYFLDDKVYFENELKEKFELNNIY